MKKRLIAFGKAASAHRTKIAWAIWTTGIALIVWGALLRSFEVLDKPTSTDAVKQGVNIRLYSEAMLVSAVSTDKVVLGSDGILKTVPDQGFCES